MKRIALLLCLLTTFTLPLLAQKYIIDDNFGDSVNIFKITLSDPQSDEETLGEPAFKMAMGEEVEVTRLLKGKKNYGAIKIDGQEYGVKSRYLLFSEENPEGTEDIFGNTRERTNHSWAGKFFATFTPYAIIALLFILAIVFMLWGFKNIAVRARALYVVPGCMIIASLLEVWAYITLGTDAFWWCSMDNYGFWGSLIRAIPFVLFVAYQLYSIKLYERLLLGKDSSVKLSIKPLAISLAICIPLMLIAVFALTSMGLKSALRDILTILTFLVSLGIGVLISFRKNVKVLGKVAGTAFTVFGIAYIIGSIVAVIGAVIMIFEIIVQILVICAAFAGLAFAMSHSGGSGGGGSTRTHVFKKSDGTWGDSKGRTFKSEHEARSNNL